MKKGIAFMVVFFLITVVSIIVYDEYSNRPYRGMGIIAMSLLIFTMLLWMIAWILPGLLLNDLPRGKKIYFIHFIAGVLFFAFGLLSFSAWRMGAWDFGNFFRGVAITSIYTAWGLILLIYSIRRRNRWKKEQVVDETHSSV